MAQVFERSKRFEPYVGGVPYEDVAVYLSTASKCDLADNGREVDDPGLSQNTPHVDAVVNACKALMDRHVPYTVVTKKNLAELSKYKVLVLPNVLMMDEQEAVAFREYVQSGGNLYASKWTSLRTIDGTRKADFLLSDVFGVTFMGETKESYTYIAPESDHASLFCGYSQQYPLGMSSSQLMVSARPGSRVIGRGVLPYTVPPDWSGSRLTSAQILGRVVLPYTDPEDPRRYASIHSNPPGIWTDLPAIVLNSFGDGKAIYVAGELENEETHRDAFINLIRLLCPRYSLEADAPKSVEVTAFLQAEDSRVVISLLNFQKETPNIPVEGVVVRLRLDEGNPDRLVILPDDDAREYFLEDGYVRFTCPRLETFLMFALYYKGAG
jgi:hypothetical protein